MKRKEIIIFGILLTAANLPLLFGGFAEHYIYLPEKVLAGQWWRTLTHPFVHISLYHLLLDGAAFLLLYTQLAEQSVAKRLGYLLGIHVSVVCAVTLSLPAVQATGYCGLSGIAHGLMAVWCLERIIGLRTCPVDKSEGWIAIVVFAGLVVKCVYEVAAGHAFLASTHLGDVGVPMVISHLAGVIGAAISFCLFNVRILKLKSCALST